MAFFPIFNIIFLIILFRIHKRIFYISTTGEILLYILGVWYIEDHFSQGGNQFLYYFALTGAGLVVGLAAFFVAISLNHKHLYEDHVPLEKRP